MSVFCQSCVLLSRHFNCVLVLFDKNICFDQVILLSPPGRCKGSDRGGATGPTGDQAESKRASSGSPDLPVSISPVACRA